MSHREYGLCTKRISRLELDASESAT